QVEVGYRLGSDEGEAIARGALIRLLEVRPDDDAAWERFLELYHDDAVWRRADRALALHPDDPAAALRRGVIAVALEEPARADSLATGVLARRGPDVSAWLVRAAASFQLGRDSTGYAWYDSALAHADIDSSGVLWDNVRLIATPDEAARFAATGLGDARRFFLWFWGKRDPNLVTPWNERSAGLQLGGDYIFTPTTARQAADTRRLLETDRTRLGAPLSPRVWVAFFRGRTPGRTEVYYRSAPDTAGVALWDERGVAAALAAGPGLLRVSVPPGRHGSGPDA